MGLGISIFLVAVGAVMTFAVHATFSTFSVGTIGIILMAVGAFGILLDLILLGRRRTVVTTSDPAYSTRQTVVHDHDMV